MSAEISTAGEGSLHVLRAAEIEELTRGREQRVMELVADAYRAHAAGRSSLPHSIFLRFPHDDLNRIIGLPAFLGADSGNNGDGVAGMKWIASFPGNVGRGMARASAVLILNSTDTGRPRAVLESSLISAQRTAASAAVAAATLHGGRRPESVGMVGTGLINREIARFLRAALPGLRRFRLFDLDRSRAEAFGRSLEAAPGGEVEIEVAADLPSLLAAEPLVSFATTAVRPHVGDLSMCPPGATLLHVSLRDLTAGAILGSDNVVDDPDHVCRASTSVHLAEQETGGRDFIRCTLADLLEGRAPAKEDESRPTVFSPFGLGVLDLAVGEYVLEQARERGAGVVVPDFLPA